METPREKLTKLVERLREIGLEVTDVEHGSEIILSVSHPGHGDRHYTDPCYERLFSYDLNGCDLTVSDILLGLLEQAYIDGCGVED